MTWQTAHFRSEEFDSPDLPGSGERMNMEFIESLEWVRDMCGFMFYVNSGYRTATYNKKVFGSKNSAHLRGMAADISITSDRNRYEILRAAYAFGFRRIEIGTIKDVKLWVHLDIDDSLPQDVLF